MKTVGFIDYYLHEWHADNYPAWIKENSGGEFEVKYVWGDIDSPLPGGLTNRAWAERMGLTLCGTMEEVIEKSDCLVVLSPDNAEQHERLSRLPLLSGKRVYVDKTFANEVTTAQHIFGFADEGGSPTFSTSALRFAPEYVGARREGLVALNSWGPGNYETYSIHQIEPIVSLMGTEAERVMYLGNEALPGLQIAFSGGRFATMFNYGTSPFMMQGKYADDETALIRVESDFFQEFIRAMIAFFRTGEPPVRREETLAVVAIRQAGFEAAKAPGTWVPVRL